MFITILQTFLVNLIEVIIVVGLFMVSVVIVSSPLINQIAVNVISISVIYGNTFNRYILYTVFYRSILINRNLNRIFTVCIYHRLSRIHSKRIINVVKITIEWIDIRSVAPFTLNIVITFKIECNLCNTVACCPRRINIINRCDFKIININIRWNSVSQCAFT